MNTPTLDQIHAAMAAKLAAVGRSKAKLAESVRDCFLDLPIDFPLTVGGHIVKWIDAECSVYGGLYTKYTMLHGQPVLLIDTEVVEEPAFEATYPDSRQHDWPCVFSGPVGGWYEAGAWDRYNALRYKYEDEDPRVLETLKKPCVFEYCKLRALREVAADLLNAMPRWEANEFIALNDKVAQIEEEVEALRKKRIRAANSVSF